MTTPPMRFLISLFLLVGLLTGCGSETESSTDTGTSGTIGMSMLTLTHPFFQDLTEAFQEAATEAGYEVILTSCEFDIARQQNQVSDFIVKQVDAIVLSPCDSKAIGTSIQAANEAGIPVFTADIAALAEGIEVISHVATNNYEGGRLAAELLLEAIGGEGKVAIIDHPEVESVILRTNGFRDVIEERNAAGADVEIVAQLPGGGAKDRAFRVAEDILQAHADIDGIFAINDETALGTVAAIEKAGRQGQLQVVGFDATPEARQAIAEGKIYGDVIQHPREIGRQTLETIVDYMAGETVESEILIPAGAYTKAEAEQDPTLGG